MNMDRQSAALLVILSLSFLFTPTCSFSKLAIYSNQRQIKHPSTSPSQTPLRAPLLSSTITRRGIRRAARPLSLETENGQDQKYPWSFTGRLWFRPSLVRVPSLTSSSTTTSNPPPTPPPSVSIVNLFGWTLGGTVALEYDDSPVGPYLEYVTMGALVTKRGALGQWGSRLYVSTKEAADVCRDTWNVPAQLADIEFMAQDEEDSSSSSSSPSLSVESAPDSMISEEIQKITVGGWENTRVLDRNDKGNRLGGLPVLWTPSIKALWAPFILLPPYDNEGDSDGAGDNKVNNLPLHRLRLSASALRLTLCGQKPSDALGIPIGIGLVIDDVLIEIARQDGDL
mmetsp:Transcript_24440/g.28804  ORF Transcript_24440/g.28804 Transcript_24440/m.28804 type:complete len:341 (+) Transcript_24440:38-1060(+)